MIRAECTECLTQTRRELLEDGGELAPFAGLLCPDCYARMLADVHDDAACACAVCARVEREREAVRRLVDARANGGLRIEVLRGGWADGG